MTFNICWQSDGIAFCILLIFQTASVHWPEKKGKHWIWSGGNIENSLHEVQKLMFLTERWMDGVSLLSSAVVQSGFWWNKWVLNASFSLRDAQEGSWDCSRNEAWGPSPSSCPEPSATDAQVKVTSQTHLSQFRGSGWSRISRTKQIRVQPASRCPEHLGWLVLPSLSFLCSCKWSSGHGRSCCREVLQLYISSMVLKSYSWEKWQIPGEQHFFTCTGATQERCSLEVQGQLRDPSPWRKVYQQRNQSKM